MLMRPENVRARLAVGDLLHGAISVNMNVQPVGLVVHRHHITVFDNAMLIGQFGLGKGHFVAALADFLAHEFVVPIFRFGVGRGHEAWDYERHVDSGVLGFF